MNSDRTPVSFQEFLRRLLSRQLVKGAWQLERLVEEKIQFFFGDMQFPTETTIAVLVYRRESQGICRMVVDLTITLGGFTPSIVLQGGDLVFRWQSPSVRLYLGPRNFQVPDKSDIRPCYISEIDVQFPKEQLIRLARIPIAPGQLESYGIHEVWCYGKLNLPKPTGKGRRIFTLVSQQEFWLLAEESMKTFVYSDLL